MKLNGEIRALLLRNELEDNQSQLCSRNKLTKQVFVMVISKEGKKSEPKDKWNCKERGIVTAGSKLQRGSCNKK